jgi:L-iditol 2-dehydrogenase
VLYRLPDNLSFEQAAMVEPVAVAVHAVRRVPKISPSDTVAVVGSGMIGLFVIQALRWAGAQRIVAIDLEEKRLALARDLGATDTIKSEGDVVGQIARMTGGRGADISFEVVGITPTVNLALNMVRRGGAAVFVGNLAPKVEFPLQIVVTRELTIYGSTGSSGEYPICIDLISRGIVRVEPMMSAVAPLEEGRAWFERLSAKDGGSKYMKVVLKP